MSRLLLLRPRAEADLEKARDWYEEKCPGLGDRFVDAVATAMNDLEADPLLFREDYRGFRRTLTPTFPYKIFFRVENERIVVFRILHARQDHPIQLETD
jgi:plasmid stabilization system protein ParE